MEWMDANHAELSAELAALWSATSMNPGMRSVEDIVADQLAALDAYLAQRDR